MTPVRLLSATLVALALIVPATASSQAEPDQAEPAFDPNVPLPTEADYQALFDRQPPDEATIVEETTAAERDDSATAFADASDAAALDLVREEFGDIVRAELFPEVDVPAGEEIAYVGKYSAVVGEDVASGDGPLGGVVPLSPEDVGENALVQSTVPLQAPEGGEVEPLDADLEQVGDHFEPENAVVNTEIPVSLEQGIELESAEVAVTPASTDGAQATQVSDKLFYPNTDADTDTLVAPLPNGVEIFFQLRSADSPEAHALDLNLPEGAELVPAVEGGAQVIADGEVLIDIPPASAWDAAGTQVEVSYELSGNRLTVAVPHRDREDVLYPILVDPIVDNYPWNPGPQETRNLDFWNTHTHWPGHFNSFFHEEKGGLMTRAVGGKLYGAGLFGQWQVWPIRASYIEAMGYHNFDHDRTEPATCTILAIWDPQTQSFAWGNWYDSPSNTTGWGQGTYLCADAAHQTKAVWVGHNQDPDGEGVGDPEAPDGSMGLFVLRSEQGGNRSFSSENLLRGANVHRGDRNYPSITSAPTSSWSAAPSVSVHDPGLGVSGVGVFESNGGGQNWVSGGGSAYCSGAHQAVCPDWTTLNLVDLPEGRRTLYAQAFDAVWNGSFPWQWTARIDRTGPVVNLSGSLWDRRGDYPAPLAAGSYSLQVAATDGNGSSAASERSGVKNITVTVQGRAAYNSGAVACAQGSCPLNRSWTLDTNAWPAGPADIKVTATDHAGNSSSQTFTVVIPGDVNPVLNTALSRCTVEDVPITPEDEAALAAADPGSPVEDLTIGTDCVGPGLQTLAAKSKGCVKMNNVPRFDYTFGAYLAWLRFQSKFCFNRNTERTVKRGGEIVDYDFSDAYNFTHNMEHYGYAGHNYGRWSGSNRGHIFMRARFEIEECFTPGGPCPNTDTVTLVNRGRADGKAVWWHEGTPP